MFDWIKNINKDYPDFWRNHLALEKKSNRIVVLSTETTGLNPEKDVILSIGAVGIFENSIQVGDAFDVVIDLSKQNLSNESQNVFLVESKFEKIPEYEAIKQFVIFLGNATIVGHRVDFDLEIINAALAKMNCGSLKNEALDIEVMYRKWKQIPDSKQFNIQDIQNELSIENTDRISAIEDAYIIGLLFLKLKSRLKF
jgi:DNA polymerase III subunit epsilon